ncbi:MAG: N-acetyl-gamma-glutamyl-phosphate reductase [Bifidobacteriaceae bacterium]|nr:N-acetyl-gamma-glutamyl-phosphate reductase [Bifidobacteriaceae bacterium]
MTYSVAVVGASGYAGGEVVRILAQHPQLQLSAVMGHSSAGTLLGEHLAHVPQYANMPIQSINAEQLSQYDIVFLALPHGKSGALAEQISSNTIVVDLGADHRLESKLQWDEYYGGTYYNSWVYGMPELIINANNEKQRANIAQAKHIAGTGCNVTAVSLAIAPAIAHNLIQRNIVADCAVGYSGAGKNLTKPLLLASEAFNNAQPYSVGGSHRHIPEMIQNFIHASGGTYQYSDFTLGFTPILVPMSRGIMAVVSAPLSEKAAALNDEEIAKVYSEAYLGEQFIHVLEQGRIPNTANVLGSNNADIQVCVDRKAQRLYAFCAIDNLYRGTAGQATQSLNIALGLPEDAGLSKIGVAP